MFYMVCRINADLKCSVHVYNNYLILLIVKLGINESRSFSIP